MITVYSYYNNCKISETAFREFFQKWNKLPLDLHNKLIRILGQK